VAYCWGQNFYGEVGDGTTATQRNNPTLVSGGVAFAKLTAGSYYTCGLTAAGVAYCWGSNGDGELGDGTITDRSVPTLVIP
jgi:alpha-tubulin suppressor-like RCC1 family protein